MDRANIVSRKHSDEKQAFADDLRLRLTRAEQVLWQEVRNNRQGVKIRRQQVIDGFIADFYVHSAGLVIELDGGIHEDTREYDNERDKIIAARGLRVLRIRNERVIDDLQGVLTEIRQAIAIGATSVDTA
jgi:very-short-patch-repair endonuclease